MKKAIQIAYNRLFDIKCRYAAEAGFRHVAVNLRDLIYPEVNLTLKNVVGTPNSVVTDGKHTVNLMEIR